MPSRAITRQSKFPSTVTESLALPRTTAPPTLHCMPEMPTICRRRVTVSVSLTSKACSFVLVSARTCTGPPIICGGCGPTDTTAESSAPGTTPSAQFAGLNQSRLPPPLVQLIAAKASHPMSLASSSKVTRPLLKAGNGLLTETVSVSPSPVLVS